MTNDIPCYRFSLRNLSPWHGRLEEDEAKGDSDMAYAAGRMTAVARAIAL